MIRAEDKEKILKANMSNIVRKVKAGKPLSKQELAMISEQPEEAPADTEGKRIRTKPFATMKAAAGAMGIPIEILKTAKNLGCPGFDGSSRVYWDKVGPWLDKNRDLVHSTSQNAPKDEKVIWSGKREKLKFEKESNKLWPKSNVLKHCTSIAERQKQLLITKCRNELAPKLEGIDTIQRIEVLEQFALEICAVFAAGLLKMEKEIEQE